MSASGRNKRDRGFLLTLASAAMRAEFRASRKPLSFVRFVAAVVFRFAVRRFATSLSHLPPRFTRFAPLGIIHRLML
jgi:hypothetical protein